MYIYPLAVKCKIYRSYIIYYFRIRDKFYTYTIKFNSVVIWKQKIEFLFCKVFVCLITLRCVNKCTEKELQVYRYFALMLFCAFHLCTSHFKITFIKYEMKYLLCDVLFPIPQFVNIKVGKKFWTKYRNTEEIVCNRKTKFLLIYIYIYFPPHATTCPLRLRGLPPPPRLWLKCNQLLRLGRPVGAVTLSR